MLAWGTLPWKMCGSIIGSECKPLDEVAYLGIHNHITEGTMLVRVVNHARGSIPQRNKQGAVLCNRLLLVRDGRRSLSLKGRIECALAISMPSVEPLKLITELF